MRFVSHLRTTYIFQKIKLCFFFSILVASNDERTYTVLFTGTSLFLIYAPWNGIRSWSTILQTLQNLDWEPRKSTNTAFYWQVPRAGGTTMKNFYGFHSVIILIHFAPRISNPLPPATPTKHPCKEIT